MERKSIVILIVSLICILAVIIVPQALNDAGLNLGSSATTTLTEQSIVPGYAIGPPSAGPPASSELNGNAFAAVTALQQSWSPLTGTIMSVTVPGAQTDAAMITGYTDETAMLNTGTNETAGSYVVAQQSPMRNVFATLSSVALVSAIVFYVVTNRRRHLVKAWNYCRQAVTWSRPAFNFDSS